MSTMEASQVFHRCVRHALARSAGCRQVIGTRRHATLLLQQHQSTIIASTRAFTSSVRVLADEHSQSQPVSQISDIENELAVPPTPAQPARPARKQRSFEPDDADRIDLSTLPGIPADYVAPRRTPEQRSATDKLNALLDKPTSQRSSQPFRSGSASKQKQPSSTFDFYDAFEAPRKPSGTGANTFTGSQDDYSNLLSALDLSSLPSGNRSVPSNIVPDSGKLPLRLRPTLGRTQSVRPESGIDLTRAFRSLEIKCAANSVKRDEISQRFHVRRGQKKKLDKSRRWRILFKEGFLHECGRVRRMMRQGW